MKLKKLKKNLPTILSVAAGFGVIFTGISSARDTIKAQKESTTVGKVASYIPTVAIAGGTIACIIGSNRISKKQYASLFAAYTLLENEYQKYKKGVKEVLGEEAHQKVIEHIVKSDCNPIEHIVKSDCNPPDIWTANFIGEIQELIPSNLTDPDQLRTFYDLRSCRYFESTLARVIQAEYYLNRDMNLGRFITLNDMYAYFGLEGVPGGDDVGYDVCDEYYWLDFNHKLMTLEDGMEVIGIDVAFDPVAPE